MSTTRSPDTQGRVPRRETVGDGPAASPPAKDPLRWKALALLCTAFFMVQLDAQIVLLALPTIQEQMGLTPSVVQWVMSAYLVTFGGLLLLGGRLADLLGRRRVFLVGTALFLLSSLLAGVAWSGGVLIAGRVGQGVSAALMAPTALSILMTTFTDGKELNKALGIWTMNGAGGAMAALLVGGPITDGLGWEWIFLINIPVALLLLGLAPVLLRESRQTGVRRSFDPAGAITVTLALGLLIYAVVDAPAVGWGSGRTLGLLAGSAALLLLFVIVESRSASPLVPLRVFRSRNLVGGNLMMLMIGVLAYGAVLVVSLYAQQVLGYSALVFGVSTVVYTVMSLVGSYGGQAVITRIGFRPIALLAMLLMGAGCLLLTGISVDGSYFGDLFPGLFVFGLGLGMGFVAASIAALTGVAPEEAGLASGINNAAFQMGGALGVAVMTTITVSHTVGSGPKAALTEGFQAGFVAWVVLAAAGLLMVFALLRRPAEATA